MANSAAGADGAGDRSAIAPHQQVVWTAALVRKHAANFRKVIAATAGNGRVYIGPRADAIDITKTVQEVLDKAMMDVGVVEFYKALETP